MSNLLPVKNFNRHNFLADDVKYQHAFSRRESYVPVAWAICSVGFRQHVKHSAEIIAAATSFDQS